MPEPKKPPLKFNGEPLTLEERIDNLEVMQAADRSARYQDEISKAHRWSGILTGFAIAIWIVALVNYLRSAKGE